MKILLYILMVTNIILSIINKNANSVMGWGVALMYCLLYNFEAEK